VERAAIRVYWYASWLAVGEALPGAWRLHPGPQSASPYPVARADSTRPSGVAAGYGTRARGQSCG